MRLFYNFINIADKAEVRNIMAKVTTPVPPTKLSQAKYYKHCTTMRKGVEGGTLSFNDNLRSMDKKPVIHCVMATHRVLGGGRRDVQSKAFRVI